MSDDPHARLSVLESQFLNMNGKLDHILAKVDDLTNNTPRMAVLEAELNHQNDALGRAFSRIEGLETQNDDQQKFIHRVTGALILINIVWPVVIGFLTYAK